MNATYGVKGNVLGTVTELAFNNCTVDGMTLSLSSGMVAWPITGVSYKSGVTRGTISKIHFIISSSECDAVIDGTSGSAHNGKVEFTFTNKTNKLKLLGPGGNLHVWDVKGCLGAISDRDAGTITSTYTPDPAETITKS